MNGNKRNLLLFGNSILSKHTVSFIHLSKCNNCWPLLKVFIGYIVVITGFKSFDESIDVYIGDGTFSTNEEATVSRNNLLVNVVRTNFKFSFCPSFS